MTHESRRDSPFNCRSWRSTLLNSNPSTFSVDDIKQLLINRGAIVTKTNKSELIQILRSNYNVYLTTDQINKLSSTQIMAELRLHGLNQRNARSRQLKSRLHNAMINKLPKWIELEDTIMQGRGNHPFYSKGLQLNDCEYIFSDKYGLHKYNSSNDTWETLMKYELEKLTTDPQLNTICLNKQNKRIYVADHYSKKMITVSYETENVSSMNLCLRSRHDYSEFMLCIGNELHMFREFYSMTNSNTLTHRISNCDKIEFTLLHKFNRINDIKDIVYLRNKQKIYLLGMDKIGYHGDLKLLTFCCRKKEWNVLGVSFSNTVATYNYGIIVTRNEQYVILYPKCGDNIYVIDMNAMKIMDTYIQCPKSASWNGMLITTEYEQELIVFGWVRYCWKVFDIGEDMFPPQYLIRLMLNWYSNEDMDYVYLLEEAYTTTHKKKQKDMDYSYLLEETYTEHKEKQKGKGHWKMRIGSIVNNLKEN